MISQQVPVFVLTGGEVLGSPQADAVRIAAGRIEAVGRGELLAADGVPAFDVEGRMILPGFIDAHTHIVQNGLVETGWLTDLSGLTRAEALSRLSQRAAERRPGEWIVAGGWDEGRWRSSEYLARQELDRVVPLGPALAVRVDGHLLVANSAALERKDVQAALAVWPQSVDADRGLVWEEAASALRRLARPNPEELVEAVRAAAKLCHRLGITGTHVMAAADEIEVLFEEAAASRIRLQVYPPVRLLDQLVGEGLCTGDGSDWARWGGVKLFADGSVGARNAAMHAPYLDGGCGSLNYEDHELAELIGRADRRGWQTAIHAIGDRAIEQVIATHERVGTKPELRHRVEHFEFPDRVQIERAARVGLSACMQPNFTGNWSGPGKLYDRALGGERDVRSNPLRAVLAAGMPLGFGSDGMPLSPAYGIRSAIASAVESQRLTLPEALTAYTSGAARLAGCEEDLGKIRPGIPADLVVVGRAAFEPWRSLSETEVSLTLVGGERAYQRLEDR